MASGNSTRVLPQKLHVYYEELFQNKEPWKKRANFWNDFFVLKIRGAAFQDLLNQLLDNAALREERKIIVYELFRQCVNYLDDDNAQRIDNAFNTLVLLLLNLFRKRSCNFTVDILPLMAEQGDEVFKELSLHLCKHMSCDTNNSLRFKSLIVLTSLLTATETLSANRLVSFLLKYDLCDALIQCIACTNFHDDIILYAIFSLGVICQYNDPLIRHVYREKLALLSDDRALFSVLRILSQYYTKCFAYVAVRAQQSQAASWSYSISHWIPGLNGHVKLPRFIQQILSEHDPIKLDDLRTHRLLSCLLLLAELMTHNCHFLTCMIPSAHASDFYYRDAMRYHADEHSVYASREYSQNNDYSIKQSGEILLFSQYLSLCSVFSQNTMDERSMLYAKLMLRSLKGVSTDDLMMTRLHDQSIRVSIPAYNRSLNAVETLAPQSLAANFLDILLMIQKNNLRRDLPVEIYLMTLDLFFDVIYYQRRFEKKLQYAMINIVAEMLVFLQYLTTHRSHFVNMPELSVLLEKVMRVVNFFVAFGEILFSDENKFYEYLYDLIRSHDLFDKMEFMLQENRELNPRMRISLGLNAFPEDEFVSPVASLASLALQASAMEEVHNVPLALSAKAPRVRVDLSYVRTVYGYFYKKIQEWCIANQNDQPRAIQIHAVIRECHPGFKTLVGQPEFPNTIVAESSDAFMQTMTRMMLSDHRHDSTRYILQEVATDA